MHNLFNLGYCFNNMNEHTAFMYVLFLCFVLAFVYWGPMGIWKNKIFGKYLINIY